MTNIKYTDADLADANNTAGITEQYTVEYDRRGFIIGEQLDIDYSTTEVRETTILNGGRLFLLSRMSMMNGSNEQRQ